MDDAPDFGLDVSGLAFNLEQLEAELKAAGIPVNGLTLHGPSRTNPTPPGTTPDPALPPGTKLWTHAADGSPLELPPEAMAIVQAHIPA